jgi:murein DD-endopeptidase
MKINWKKIFELEQKQFETMSEHERFVYFLLLQYKSPYL